MYEKYGAKFNCTDNADIKSQFISAFEWKIKVEMMCSWKVHTAQVPTYLHLKNIEEHQNSMLYMNNKIKYIIIIIIFSEKWESESTRREA